MNLSSTTRRITGALASVVAISALALFSAPAHAQTLYTFAEFGRNASTGTGAFRFTNNGANSTFGLVNSTVPVRFQYDTANSYGPANTSIPALVSVTANVAAPATLLNGTITQYLSNITISFTAVNPQGGLTNLLTANFGAADGSISFASGAQAGGQATLSAGNTNAVGVANYTSDFLDFSNNANQIFKSEQFSLSFSGVNNIAGGTA